MKISELIRWLKLKLANVFMFYVFIYIIKKIINNYKNIILLYIKNDWMTSLCEDDIIFGKFDLCIFSTKF